MCVSASVGMGIAAIVGGTVNAVNAYAQAQQQSHQYQLMSRASQNEAQMLRLEQERQNQVNERERARASRSNAQLAGRQTNAFVGSGIDPFGAGTSANEVLGQTAYSGAYDVGEMRAEAIWDSYAYENRINNSLYEAQSYRSAAKTTRGNGLLNAGMAFVGGIAQAYGAWASNNVWTMGQSGEHRGTQAQARGRRYAKDSFNQRYNSSSWGF